MSFRSLFNRQLIQNNSRKTHLNCDHLLKHFRCMRVDVKTIEPDFDPLRTDNLSTDEIVPMACKFSLLDPTVLAISYEDGTLAIHNTEIEGDGSYMYAAKYYQNAIFDVEWIPGERYHLLAASATPGISCFDMTRDLPNQDTAEGCVIFRGHTATVKTISHRPSDSWVFVSGARDGTIMIWDRRRQNKKMNQTNPITVLPEAHVVGKDGKPKTKSKIKILPTSDNSTIACVLFQDEFTFFSAGTRDQHIKVWDLRYLRNGQPKVMYMHESPTIKKGYSFITFDKTKSRLFANCMNNNIYEYDLLGKLQTPVNTYSGHRNETFYIRSSVSPNNRYLISGSSDGDAHIWPISRDVKPRAETDGYTSIQPCCKLANQENELSVALWSPKNLDRIVTLSDNNRAQIWKISGENMNKTPLGGSQVYSRAIQCKRQTTEKQRSLGHYRCINVDNNGESRYRKIVTTPHQFKIFSRSRNTDSFPISPTFSPLKWPTPRKVTVTPRKMNQEHQSLSVNMSHPHTVKRNLYGSSNTDDLPLEDDMNIESPCKRTRLTSPPSPDSRLPSGTPRKHRKQDTPTSRRIIDERCTSRFRSPTSNLPDSIRDGSYLSSLEVSRGSTDFNKTPKQDWLTERIKSSTTPSEKSANRTSLTPNRIKKAVMNSQLTPKIRKATPRRRLNTTDHKDISNDIKPLSPVSIKKFFSPVQRKL